jgi:hypothetical protein
VSKSEDAFVPIPSAGLRAVLSPVRWVDLFLEAKGFSIGSPGTVIDVEGGVSFNPIRNVGIIGGYRYMSIEVDVSDVDADFQWGGAFLSIAGRF